MEASPAQQTQPSGNENCLLWPPPPPVRKTQRQQPLRVFALAVVVVDVHARTHVVVVVPRYR